MPSSGRGFRLAPSITPLFLRSAGKPVTMSRIITEMARKMPGGLALADERMSLTWAEFEPAIDRGERWAALDLGPDKRELRKRYWPEERTIGG